LADRKGIQPVINIAPAIAQRFFLESPMEDPAEPGVIYGKIGWLNKSKK